MKQPRLLVIEPNDCHSEIIDSIKFLLSKIWPSLSITYIYGLDNFLSLRSNGHDIHKYSHIIFTSSILYANNTFAPFYLDGLYRHDTKIASFYHNTLDLNVLGMQDVLSRVFTLSSSTSSFLSQQLPSLRISTFNCLSEPISISDHATSNLSFIPNILICGQFRVGKGVLTILNAYRRALEAGLLKLSIILTNYNSSFPQDKDYFDQIESYFNAGLINSLSITTNRMSQPQLDKLVSSSFANYILDAKRFDSHLKNSQTTGALYLSRRYSIPLICEDGRFTEIDYAHRFIDKSFLLVTYLSFLLVLTLRVFLTIKN